MYDYVSRTEDIFIFKIHFYVIFLTNWRKTAWTRCFKLHCRCSKNRHRHGRMSSFLQCGHITWDIAPLMDVRTTRDNVHEEE